MGDALTTVALWIAFALSLRPATRRYNYEYGRLEDVAGLFIVIMITLSACDTCVPSLWSASA